MKTSEKINEIKNLTGLTLEQIAKLLGQRTKQGVSNMLRGQPASGPQELVIDYALQGILDDEMKKIVPEFLIANNDLEVEAEIIIRLHYPRFLGFVCEESVAKNIIKHVDHVSVALDEVVAVAMWIDLPVGDFKKMALERAASYVNRYTRESLEMLAKEGL